MLKLGSGNLNHSYLYYGLPVCVYGCIFAYICFIFVYSDVLSTSNCLENICKLLSENPTTAHLCESYQGKAIAVHSVFSQFIFFEISFT